MFNLFKKGNSTQETTSQPQGFDHMDPADLTKLTVFGYTGKFSNHPVISIYFNNVFIGEISQNEIKTFNVPAPGMVAFKFKRAAANIAMTGEMGVQLDFDRVYGGLIAQKV